MATRSTRTTRTTVVEVTAEELESIVKRALGWAGCSRITVTWETTSAGLLRGAFVERVVADEPVEEPLIV
jgi:hypothetical protein